MHEGQLHLTPGQAAGVIARQFPAWVGLPVRPVASTGTVNLLFRIGDEMVARFPLEPGDADQKRAWLERELAAARALAGRLPVPTPEPVTLAEPDEVFPLPWVVHRWLPGAPAYDAHVAGSAAFARDLGTVVLALRAIGTGGRAFSGDARGGRLADHDDAVAAYLHDAEGMIDTDALRVLWARLRETPRDQPDVTTHGDLMPGNLLVMEGSLAAVIDVGMAGPADPALDLQPAWNLLDEGARTIFRATVGSTDDEWDRGKGWALAQAIGCLAYYRETNPTMSRTAHRTLTAILTDETDHDGESSRP